MSLRNRLKSVATSERVSRFKLVTAELRWTYLGFAALAAFMSAGTILSDVLLDDNPSHRQHQVAALHVSLAVAATSATFFVLAICGWVFKWFPLAAIEPEHLEDGTVWPPPPKSGT